MTPSPNIRAALIYDFDGTVAEGNCAEHGLMQALGISDVGEFWGKVKQATKDRDADEILIYLGSLALQARVARKREELSPERLRAYGAQIPLFPGVVDWFERINVFAADQGLRLEHYIVSSGLEEMIYGTSIAKHFKKVFACRYHYDEKSGYAKWPAAAVNYTTKTQYIFRINKGVLNSYDNTAVNRFVEHQDRPVPFNRMIYFGDGDTDIPSMKLVKEQGGCSLAVFDEKKWEHPNSQEKIQKLIAEDRVSYVVPGNYAKGTQLDVTVKGVLSKILRQA